MKGLIVLAVLFVLALSSFVRITETRLGWGHYWSVSLALPWHR